MKYYPMLAKAGTESNLGSTRYQYEYKLDGQRCLLYIDATPPLPVRVTLFSRTGRDISRNFPEIVSHISARVWMHSHVFDGEIVCYTQGKVDFQALSTRMQRKHSVGEAQKKSPASFIAFDVLVSYDNDITDWHLDKRRARLEHYEQNHSPFDITYVIPSQDVHDVYDAIIKSGDEGIMAKLLASPYRHAERTDEWLKIKPTRTMTVHIGGCTWGTGRRTNEFGAILVGVPPEPYKDVEPYPPALRYLGSVGTGFTDPMLRDLRILMDDNEIEGSPFVDYPLTPATYDTIRAFCRPKLRARVEYQELTKDGKLRFPTFKELLVD